MDTHSNGEVLSSAFSWALWKVLDKLSQRHLGADAHTAPAGVIPADLIDAMDPERVAAAARELSDEGSPLVLALARIAAARSGGMQAEVEALQPLLESLSSEQLLVLAGVMVQIENPSLAG